HARRAAMVGALGLAVLVAIAPGSARAEDDDDDNKNSIWNLDKRFMTGIMKGLGFKNGSENQVEYRERSPLVIPPSRELPPPQQAGAGQTPAWPSDPDVKRRKAAAEKRKNAIYDPDKEVGNLSPSELNRPGGSTRASAGTNTDGSDVGKNESPSGLG